MAEPSQPSLEQSFNKDKSEKSQLSPAALERIHRLRSDPRVRRPVIEHREAKELVDADIEHQWGLLKSAIHQEMLSDPDFRTALITLIQEPLSEELPGLALTRLASSSPRIAALQQRYTNGLSRLLQLQPVPDELLGENLYGIHPSWDMVDRVESEREWTNETEEVILSRLEDRIAAGAYEQSVTAAEFRLVKLRYRYARELTLLALGAELLEHPIQTSEAASSVTLPSGTQLALSPSSSDLIALLTTPDHWQTKTAVTTAGKAHRAFIAEVDGRRFVVKEHRTGRHDLKSPYGNLSAKEEFHVAEKLNQALNTESTDSLLQTTWETPIAAATFPNNYQFVVYEYADELIPDGEADHALRQAILDHPETFQAEFSRVRASIQTALAAPDLNQQLRDWHIPQQPRTSTIGQFFKRLSGSRPDTQPDFTYTDFAAIKSRLLRTGAYERLARAIRELGYIPQDSIQHQYRIGQTGESLTVELIGYDAEHFSRRSDKTTPSALLDEPFMTVFQDEVRATRLRSNAAVLAAFYVMLGDLLGRLKNEARPVDGDS